MEKTKPRKRGSVVPIPSWWIQMAERRRRTERRHDGTIISLKELGAELALIAKRTEPWSHTKLSKFFGEEFVTGDIADALMERFPELPAYIYLPEDPEEALEYEMARKRAEARRKREGGQIDRHLGVIDDALASAASAVPTQRGESARHPTGVISVSGKKRESVARDPVERNDGRDGKDVESSRRPTRHPRS